MCFVPSLCSWFISTEEKRMLFMGSLCRGISLKFLCTSPVWGRWVTLALFDDIILLLKPFLLADWLTSACATEPSHYTLTLPTYWQTHTYCFPLGIFQEGFGLFIPALSTRSHFSLASSVFPTEVSKEPWPSEQCVSGILEPPVIFSYETLTQAVFVPIFLPCTSSLLAVQIQAGAC